MYPQILSLKYSLYFILFFLLSTSLKSGNRQLIFKNKNVIGTLRENTLPTMKSEEESTYVPCCSNDYHMSDIKVEYGSGHTNINVYDCRQVKF